jgi:hypothetical protein
MATSQEDSQMIDTTTNGTEAEELKQEEEEKKNAMVDVDILIMVKSA